MVVSGLSGEDERRALDYFSTRLEMMVKELGFGLIFVSHVNDEGKTRGSRYISKICDIRIDLFRDMTNEDEAVRNTLQTVVALNRYSGKTGPADTLIFDQDSYSFKQVGGSDETSDYPGELVAGRGV
jgi:twinkle protein